MFQTMASEDITQSTSSSTLFSDNQDVFYFEDTSFHQHYTVRQMTLRKEKLFTDVLLKSKNLAIPCHKVALSSASPFFYRKLTSGEVSDIMEFQNVEPEILELLIDYIYTATIEIATGNVKALVKAGAELELKSLKKACDGYIADRTQPANAMGLVMFAKNHDLEATKKKAMECLMTRPDDVLRLALDGEF